MRTHYYDLAKRLIFHLILILISASYCQDVGLRRSVTDSSTGKTFNNFRTDTSEVVFYQILKPAEILFSEPKNNADPVYSLNQNMFVEEVEGSKTGNFIKVRLIDKFHGIIEGWVRTASLKKMRYYGNSFSKSENNFIKTDQFEKKKNPHWIKNDIESVYSDSTLTTNAATVLRRGDIVYVESFSQEYFSIYFEGENNVLLNGYVDPEGLSELAVIHDPSTDFDLLFQKYDPVLLKNDIDRSGFVSYSGIRLYNNRTEEFTEDKVCREISSDSLLYRYSTGSGVSQPKKHVDTRNNFEKANISMYRFLPDEKIITSMDTISCSVIKYVSVPRMAMISFGNTEEAKISNSITKIFITEVDKFDMSIVFHRETITYTWSYSKDLSTGEIIKSDTDTEKTVKRLTAFRKH